MRNKITIKNNKALFSVIGLALLLLFSPCKIRNYVEAELNLPQTEVANKSKTTISNANCNTSELSERTQVANHQLQQSSAVLVAKSVLSVAIDNRAEEKQTTTYLKGSTSFLIVPLYILYRNFKVYL